MTKELVVFILFFSDNYCYKVGYRSIVYDFGLIINQLKHNEHLVYKHMGDTKV